MLPRGRVGVCSNYLDGAQAGDLLGLAPQGFAQDLVGVLAEQGRRDLEFELESENSMGLRMSGAVAPVACGISIRRARTKIRMSRALGLRRLPPPSRAQVRSFSRARPLFPLSW